MYVLVMTLDMAPYNMGKHRNIHTTPRAQRVVGGGGGIYAIHSLFLEPALPEFSTFLTTAQAVKKSGVKKA